MMTRIHWGKIIPARWFSLVALAGALAAFAAAPPKRPIARAVTAPRPASGGSTGALAALVRAYREAPSAARRAAVEAYADAHTKETGGSLARLALGVVAYEQKQFPDAVAALRPIATQLPAIADYTAYFLGAARVESGDLAGVSQDLASALRADQPSPWTGRAWLLAARAFKDDPPQAVRLLRDHYGVLPQPAGDVTLADAYLAAGDMPRAADFYQRVYFDYVSGDAAARAAAALVSLKESLGASYPPPLPRQMLRRADRLLDARQYRDAKREYQDILPNLAGLDRDQARVGIGAADYLNGNTAVAYPYLRALELPESEADAARLYYLFECARKLTDEDEMRSALNRLAQVYRRSPWRLKALSSAANRFLVDNRPTDFVPVYRAIFEDFPSDPAAAAAHWKVAFEAYLNDQPDAEALLREHLVKYTSHATAGAALYFLARHNETVGDFAAAAAFYRRLTVVFPNTYYAILSRDRLTRSELQAALPSEPAARFLASLSVAELPPIVIQPGPATTLRIERARLLRTAGLNDLADSELRFGARNGGQPVLLAMEMAAGADAPHIAMRDMKSLSGDYLDLSLANAPRQFWELLFPMPYRSDLVAAADAHNIDPYLLAGLIRQESEFNPEALSRANAYGLTQVRPSTGRMYARRAGVLRFTNRSLFQPTTNLRIGATIFESMLEENSGMLESTLAAYNAGPRHAVEWLSWRSYREPAEFVESIPFTETREYVQAVLRNADVYRRLYKK